MKLHKINNKETTTSKKQEFGFQQLNEDTLSLKFGQCAIVLHAEGKIEFCVGQSQIVMDKTDVLITTNNNKVALKENGDVVIDGENIKQAAKQDIKLNSRRDVYLNSV